jgi:hypothetical protein
VRIRYGDGTTVSLASSRGGRYALGDDSYGTDPVPPPGHMHVVGDELGNWHGELRVEGLAVVLDASSRERLLEAARALRPRR